jgi:hypothetical protein
MANNTKKLRVVSNIFGGVGRMGANLEKSQSAGITPGAL